MVAHNTTGRGFTNSASMAAPYRSLLKFPQNHIDVLRRSICND